jgi:hypothetical protein
MTVTSRRGHTHQLTGVADFRYSNDVYFSVMTQDAAAAAIMFSLMLLR